jgi:hypothetical protein
LTAQTEELTKKVEQLTNLLRLASNQPSTVIRGPSSFNVIKGGGGIGSGKATPRKIIEF